MTIKGHMRNPCCDGNALYLDCINVNILGRDYYYSFARCYHQGETVKGSGRKFSLYYFL